MSQPAVFVTRQIDPQALQKLKNDATVDVWDQETPPPDEVLDQKLAEVDGILTMLTDPITASRIQQAGNLKAISQLAVGYDNIDVAAATQRGIPVGHTPGVLTETTADFAWALLMAAARRVIEGHNQVQAGIWKPWGPDVLTGYDVYGATLGIVGFGRIGQAVARRAKGFGMQVLYFDNNRKPDIEAETGARRVDLDELLEQSDFVSLHVYLSDETRKMIGAEQLARMKTNAILINTARGGVIDQQALLDALQNQQIAGAALDVFDPEPIPAGHPLLSLDNVIVTPHIASAGKTTRKRMAHMAVDNLLAGLQGRQMPHCANPAVYNAS